MDIKLGIGAIGVLGLFVCLGVAWFGYPNAWLGVAVSFFLGLYGFGPRSVKGWLLTAEDISEINRRVFESDNQHLKNVVTTFWCGSARK